jgi:SAM-dependent methyltransferase
VNLNIYDIYRHEYNFIDDIQFIETLLRGKEVLEVGCGDGRVLNYLNKKKKYNLFGFDIDEKVVKIAKERFNGAGINLTVGNAVTFNHERLYKNILFLFNGLMLLPSKEYQISFLQNAYNNLEDSGNLIFYISNPDVNRMSEFFPYYKYQKTLCIDNILVDKFEFNKYDLDNQLIHRVFNYDYMDKNNNLKRVVSRFVVRYFHKSELEQDLINIGFSDLKFFGDFQGSRWCSESPYILVKATK